MKYMIKDQYENPVPDDLVILEYNDVNARDAQFIADLKWYKIEDVPGVVFVSEYELTQITGTQDYACVDNSHPVYKGKVKVFKIDRPLKRWNGIAGFYHV